MKKYFKVAINILLVILVFFGLLIMLFYLPDKTGYRMSIVKSGSMAPALKTGSLIFSKAENDYFIRDIITFNDSVGSKDSITHRIVSQSSNEAGELIYTTKGDANDSTDPDPITKSQIVGKVLFSIPYLGYSANFARTLWGLILFIFIPALAVTISEILKIREEAELINFRRRQQKKLSKNDKSA